MKSNPPQLEKNDDEDDSSPMTGTSYTGNWGDLFKNQTKKWKCDSCSVLNDLNLTECPSCEAVRPGGSSSSSEGAVSASGSNAAVATQVPAMNGTIGAGGFSFTGAIDTSASSSSFQLPSSGAPTFSAAASPMGSQFFFGATSDTTTGGGFTFDPMVTSSFDAAASASKTADDTASHTKAGAADTGGNKNQSVSTAVSMRKTTPQNQQAHKPKLLEEQQQQTVSGRININQSIKSSFLFVVSFADHFLVSQITELLSFTLQQLLHTFFL